MFDYAEMARKAIDFVWPVLAAGGVAVAVGAAEKAGADVWDWLKRKLRTPAGEAALSEAQRDPSSEIKRQILTLQLQKLLDEDESARKELTDLLPAVVWQSARVEGDGDVVIQVSGSGISIHTEGSPTFKKP